MTSENSLKEFTEIFYGNFNKQNTEQFHDDIQLHISRSDPFHEGPRRLLHAVLFAGRLGV